MPCAIRQAQVGEQHVRPLPAELDARLAQRMRARDREAFHACDFLQPLHDIRVVIDDQRVCHFFLDLRTSFCGVTVLRGPVAPVQMSPTPDRND